VPEKLDDWPEPDPEPVCVLVAPPAAVASVVEPSAIVEEEPAAFCAPPAPTVTVRVAPAEKVTVPVLRAPPAPPLQLFEHPAWPCPPPPPPTAKYVADVMPAGGVHDVAPVDVKLR